MRYDTAADVSYFDKIEQIEQLTEDEKSQLCEVSRLYRFCANDYYLSLIDWNDPEDPIRRAIIPDVAELQQWGNFDPSGEVNFTVMEGMEHKYASTALLLVSNACGGICRYCFRKRVFISTQGNILRDLPAAVEYIDAHDEITNVLLTGGDPLMLPTARLRRIMESLLSIEHVKIIRIGSKMPTFNPYRITGDSELLDLIRYCGDSGKQIYIMTHFIHPRELTEAAIDGIKHLHHTGAVLANQTPLIRGINDDAEVMAELFRQLSFAGAAPYYVFQCRPASGNRHLAVPVEEGYRIFEEARSKVSGLAKRALFVMSHVTGKIEIVGVDNGKVYMKYHRSADEELNSKFLTFKSNPEAYWLDDYDEAADTKTEGVNYRSYGPE